MEKILHSFRLQIPAEKGARETGINRKTMQQHYMKIRAGLASEREGAIRSMYGEYIMDVAPFQRLLGYEILPVMGLLYREKEIHVIFPQTGTGQRALIEVNSLVYSLNRRAYEGMNIDRFMICSLCVGEEKEKGELFWSYTKKGLRRYRSGFRKNFCLFVREMEFRFNANVAEDFTRLLSTLDWQL